MRKSPLPKPGSILGALLGARGGPRNHQIAKTAEVQEGEEKWVPMVNLMIFAKFSEISHFLLQMSFPWSRSSKAYETQGILGVLGRPLG